MPSTFGLWVCLQFIYPEIYMPSTDGLWVCLRFIYPKLYVPTTTGSLVIIIKLKAKDVHNPTMFVVYFLKTFSITEYCISCNDVLQRVTRALVFLSSHKLIASPVLLLIVGNLKSSYQGL